MLYGLNSYFDFEVLFRYNPIDNSTFPPPSFLSDGNTKVKDERCPIIRYVRPILSKSLETMWEVEFIIHAKGDFYGQYYKN